MWEDPIVADVRRLRQQLFAEFNHDLDAYVEHLKARQRAREDKTGERMPHAGGESDVCKPDAA
jgi:hypothetical protein